MGPPRKSKSVNKRYLYGNEVSPTKNGDDTSKKNQRKKKSDMLGPRWSKEELERFYEAYRKHGRDWIKVAAVLQNRSVEMVEAVYSSNKAYLSLPEGISSIAGFIAMMTDYYSNMDELHSEQERYDGVETSRKPKKRIQHKVHETASKGSIGRVRIHPEAVPPDYGFLSILKKKRSGGSRPRVVGKRTPRIPISHSYENVKGEKYSSPTKKGLKLRADNEEDVAHTIAMALADASKRSGSPQVSQTPNRRSNSLMSSPCQSAYRMYGEADVVSGQFVDNDMYDDDIEGSMEADNTDLSRDRSKERTNGGYMFHGHKESQGRKVQFSKTEKKHLDFVREASSDTGQTLGTLRRNFDVEAADAKPSRSPQVSKKRSKEARTEREDNSAFDALETLANLSLMILPEASGIGRQREKRKFSGLTGKGKSRLEVADDKAQTSATKHLVDGTNAASEVKESHQLNTKVSRKRQKIVAPKATHAAQMSLSRRISQSSSPQLFKNAQRTSSSIHSRREVHNSALSDVHISEVNSSNICTAVRNKRKMYKPGAREVANYSDVMGTDRSSVQIPSLSHKTVKLKGKLYNCLSNQFMRRWCSFEWFYSAIDKPWFAKNEFVEYLYHVGLGHVPRLARVEWGVIRSSLGKPRRFSDQFLKEETDKVNQYRDSVRTHYKELCSGCRDGLPTDLARPLTVGQSVIAIHPTTREVHDGTVLTVDLDRCRVQFDQPELGVVIIMDTDCMPSNPFENLPASLMHPTPSEKIFESLKNVKVNGMRTDQRMEGYTKCSSREILENMDEVASVKSDLPSKNGTRDVMLNHHAAYSGPGTLTQIQAKEATVEAIAELTCALDKKEAVVFELRQMHDDVLKNQTDCDFALQDSDAFKKLYAAVLIRLDETNAQVFSALLRLRQRNAYQRDFHLNVPRAVSNLSDHGGISSSSDHTANHTEESECHANEIVKISRTKARTMVDIAIQAMSSLKLNPDDEIDQLVDFVSDRLPLNDSYIPFAQPNPIATNLVRSSLPLHQQLVSSVKAPDSKPVPPSDSNKTSFPSELITQCVATLFSIQKCTERQFPPAEVASILDSAVSSLQPCSPKNLQVYTDIQKCMGIIKNQILALVPT